MSDAFVPRHGDTPSEVPVEGGPLETLVAVGEVTTEGDLVRLAPHSAAALLRGQD